MRLVYPFTVLLFLSVSSAIAQLASKRQELSELAGYKYKHLTINADSSEKGLSIVIGLHWRGSTPDEFSKFLTGFKNPVRVILIQGQYPDDVAGFSFYKIIPTDYYTMSADEKMFALLKESSKVSKFIEVISAIYKPTIKPVVIGASQGGDLSYVIGILHNHLVSLSCPLLATIDDRIIKRMHHKFGVLSPIEVFHGTSDKIVPIEISKQHFQLVKTNKYEIYFHAYENNSHNISSAMMADFTKLIDDHLKGKKASLAR